MTPAETLQAVCRAGGTIEVRGDRLALKADGPLPDELVAAVRLHRESLLRMLTHWDAKLADTCIDIAVRRVSRWHDELAPGCSMDGADWDRAEALVDA